MSEALALDDRDYPAVTSQLYHAPLGESDPYEEQFKVTPYLHVTVVVSQAAEEKQYAELVRIQKIVRGER